MPSFSVRTKVPIEMHEKPTFGANFSNYLSFPSHESSAESSYAHRLALIISAVIHDWLNIIKHQHVLKYCGAVGPLLSARSITRLSCLVG